MVNRRLMSLAGREALTISPYPIARGPRKADMTDDRTARPLSDEIIAGVPRETERRMGERRVGDRREAPDIVDADFVTVASYHADRPGPAGGQPETPRKDASPGIDILKRSGGERPAQRGGPLFWAFGLCLVLAAFWVSGGHALVLRQQAGGPEAVSQPSARNALRITGVTSRLEQSGGRFFLLVDGEVANDGVTGAILPGLEIRVAGKDGRITRYFLGTSETTLEPGRRFSFSSRLEAPKDGVETVTVDFRKEG